MKKKWRKETSEYCEKRRMARCLTKKNDIKNMRNQWKFDRLQDVFKTDIMISKKFESTSSRRSKKKCYCDKNKTQIEFGKRFIK